jgi:hypothetical protein
LDDDKQHEIRALGRLGWTLSRIQEATGIRRETISGYLKAAGIPVRSRGRPSESKPKPAISRTVSTDSVGAKPAISREVSTDSGRSNRVTRVEVSGALESGRSVELPRELVERLNREEREPLERKRHVMIAEPIGGNEWTITENLIERGGRVSHRVRTRALSDEQIEQIHRETAREYIHRNWPAIQRDLNRMLNELRQ